MLYYVLSTLNNTVLKYSILKLIFELVLSGADMTLWTLRIKSFQVFVVDTAVYLLL